MCPASPPSLFIPCIFAAQGPTDETGEQVEGEDNPEVHQVISTKCKHVPFPYCLKCHNAQPDYVKENCLLWIICRWCYSPLHAHNDCPVPHCNCNSMSCIVPEMHPNYGLICICDDSCYNPPYFLPGPCPGPVTIPLLADKPPVLKDQPPIIFPSATPPDLMSKRPLPMNPPLVEDLPPRVDTPRPMSTEPLPEPLVLEPPVEPLVPIPWNIHRRQYSSMEEFVEHMIQNPVSRPVDDLDSPMSDAPPLELDPVTPYLLDSPEGHTHTLSPDKSPTEPWQQWLDHPDSPISCKHSLSPSSSSSAPIRQSTSREGSYHSITPQTSSPTASIEASSEGNQSVSSSESSDLTPSTQTPAAVDNNELLLNWVTLPHAYRKG